MTLLAEAPPVSKQLSSCRPGDIGRVTQVDLPAPDASMLRAMGLRVGAMVRISRVGEPTVVEVISGHECRCHCRCRIGVARSLAAAITLTLGA